VRYGDEDIEGVSRLLTAPIRELPTDPSTPHRYTWLGAERIGTTETFRGNFGDPAWNWDGFPDYPVLRHPVNDWEDYANEMLSTLHAEALLENTAEGFAARPDWRPLTRFETRGVARGHAVFDLLFRRR